MSKVKVELNMPGLNEIMMSPEMQAHLAQAGEQVARIAGDGYSSRVHIGDFTAIVNIFPETDGAIKDNYRNNTAMKALGASGFPGHK